MPESRSRKKPTPTPQTARPAAPEGNPRWLVPVMLGLMVLGLVWVVTYYITSANGGYPVPALERWNLAVGFGLMIAGFVLTTRWR